MPLETGSGVRLAGFQETVHDAAFPGVYKGENRRGLFTIEQVAARTGLTKRTLRYYEAVGLLVPADRTEANYRRYSEEDIQHLERIKNLRDLLGFSLADIRKLLEAEDERGQIKVAYQHETEAAA